MDKRQKPGGSLLSRFGLVEERRLKGMKDS